MFIYVHVCVFVCMYVCMYVCFYICKYTSATSGSLGHGTIETFHHTCFGFARHFASLVFVFILLSPLLTYSIF